MSGERILIVRKHPTGNSIESILEKTTYSVCGISDWGDEAIDLARKVSPDVVLMEITSDAGPELLATASRIRDELHIPVVFVVPLRDDVLLKAKELAGPCGCLTLPFGETEIRCAVETAVYTVEAEARLRESERRHRAIIDEAGAGYFFIDTQGFIREINTSWLAIHGYEHREEAVGSHFLEMHPREDRDRIRHTMNTLLRGESIPTKECRHLHRDGTTGYHTCSAHAVYRDGEIIGAEGFIIDDTRRKLLEQRGEKERRLLAAILDTVGALVVVVDRKGRIVRFNKECERATGYLFKEVKNVPIWDILLPREEIEPVKRALEVACEGGALKSHFRNHWVDKSGFQRLIDWTNSTLTDDTGAVEYVICTGVDLTERHAMQEALRISEERFAQVFRVSPMAITITTLEGGVYIDVNDAFTLSTGYTREESVGRSVNDLSIWANPEDRRRAVQVLRENGRLQDFELPFRKRSGEVRTASWSAEIVELDRKPCLISVFNDITERKRAEEALRLSEEKWSKMFRTSPGWLAVTTLEEGTFLAVNEAFCTASGYALEELLGRSAPDLGTITLQDREQLVKIAREQGGFRDREAKFRMRNGDIRFVLWSADVIELEGKTCLINASTDITELKKSEEEKRRLEAQLQHARKMEAIGTLAGGIAHDFNNILSVIIGYTELSILDLPEGTKTKSKLEQVLTAGLRAKDLINQILAFSRKSDQGNVSIQMSPLIREAMKLLRGSLPASIEIRSDIARSTECVEANPTQIHQVLLNLCANAAHAMRETGGVLGISLSETELETGDAEVASHMAPGRYFKLEVSDTGHGMPPDVMARIFEPYFTTKKLGEGTGLGLSVVHGIVKGLGGDVTVTSAPGKGSTFTVYLPITKTPAAESSETEEPLPSGSGKVLLVDDEEQLVSMGTAMLEHLGYTATGVVGGAEALNLFLADPLRFDLVITDQTMPGILGSDLAMQILNVRPDMPIILCTGYNELIDGDTARAMGIREFVMKPLEMKKLAGILRKILQGE